MTDTPKDPFRAATMIAALVYLDIGVDIEAGKILDFIRTRWPRLAPLVHAVHDAPDTTKYTPPPISKDERVSRAAARLRNKATTVRINNQTYLADELDEIAGMFE